MTHLWCCSLIHPFPPNSSWCVGYFTLTLHFISSTRVISSTLGHGYGQLTLHFKPNTWIIFNKIALPDTWVRIPFQHEYLSLSNICVGNKTVGMVWLTLLDLTTNSIHLVWEIYFLLEHLLGWKFVFYIKKEKGLKPLMVT